MEKPELEKLGKAILDSSFKVHSALGPGMLESSYEACLMYELNKLGLKVLSQEKLPIIYDGMRLEAGYRIDLFVEDEIIVEIKTVERLLPVHTAQLLSYLKLSEKKLGFLINFNVPRLMDGIKRVVNNL
jgi:GxxExxY protein